MSTESVTQQFGSRKLLNNYLVDTKIVHCLITVSKNITTEITSLSC